eukprot:1419739-Pyramimonas_sp.AAC.1
MRCSPWADLSVGALRAPPGDPPTARGSVHEATSGPRRLRRQRVARTVLNSQQSWLPSRRGHRVRPSECCCNADCDCVPVPSGKNSALSALSFPRDLPRLILVISIGASIITATGGPIGPLPRGSPARRPRPHPRSRPFIRPGGPLAAISGGSKFPGCESR